MKLSSADCLNNFEASLYIKKIKILVFDPFSRGHLLAQGTL